MVVTSGVKEGDEVVINPRAHIEEAELEALKPLEAPDSPGKAAEPKGAKVDGSKDAE